MMMATPKDGKDLDTRCLAISGAVVEGFGRLSIPLDDGSSATANDLHSRSTKMWRNGRG